MRVTIDREPQYRVVFSTLRTRMPSRSSLFAGFTERLYYKPDVYTDLDIYSGNPWKISASRYQG